VSMMYSTELREPFLDYRLVELAFAQETGMKIRNNVRKWTLRNIASRYLNADITQAPKRALQTPQREWLAGVLKPMVDKSLAVLSDHNWFNPDELKKEWDAYLQGSGDNSFFVWQWINTAELLTNN
jgi:asparagine synthase (glutamine-hydrolysing)